MPFCQNCGAQMPEGTRFCISCGATMGGATVGLQPTQTEFLVVTTPTIAGYRIKKVLGVVTGLTARTRGVGGKFVAGIQSMVGGEVSAFTYEIEKARVEATQRMREQAQHMGANAVIGVDFESSDLLNVVIISTTGTAVIVEPETST